MGRLGGETCLSEKVSESHDKTALNLTHVHRNVQTDPIVLDDVHPYNVGLPREHVWKRKRETSQKPKQTRKEKK